MEHTWFFTAGYLTYITLSTILNVGDILWFIHVLIAQDMEHAETISACPNPVILMPLPLLCEVFPLANAQGREPAEGWHMDINSSNIGHGPSYV